MNRFENITGGTTSHSTRMPNNGNQTAGYKLLMWLTALLLTAVVVGCGGQDPILGSVAAGAPAPALPAGTVSPGACTVAGPAVTSSDPTANNQFVPISTASVTPNKLITATFSLAMDPATINSASAGALSTFTLKDMTALPGTIVAGTVLYDAPSKVATFTTTTGALLPNTWYTASITNAAMAVGVPLSCSYAWNFKTAGAGAPPSVGTVNLGTAAPFGIIAYDAITIANGHIYGDVALTQPGPGGTIASVTGAGTNDSGVAPMLASSDVTTSDGVTPGVITAADNGTPANIAALPQLLVDLRAAYDDLMARAAPVTALTTPASAVGVSGGTFAAATDLSGFVLSPGIYTSPATYGLSNTNGPLVLNAGGNADAVFIIRSTQAGPSGLTSTTGSVVLQNGAQSKNVFWVLDNLTIGSATFFQGTVVAGHAITLGTFANVEGRMLAGALGLVSGAITLASTSTITVPQ